jgi:hypothetical protein
VISTMKTLAGSLLAAVLLAAPAIATMEAPAPAGAAAAQPVKVASAKKPAHHTARHRARRHFRRPDAQTKPPTPTK